MNPDTTEFVVDFQTHEEHFSEKVIANFPNEEIITSSAFSGTEVITLIVSASVLIMDKVLNFYIQNRKSLRNTSIKFGKDEITLSGFSNEEIKDMIEHGSIAKIKEQIKKIS